MWRSCPGGELISKWGSANLFEKATGWHLRPYLHTVEDAEQWRCNNDLHHYRAPWTYSVCREPWNSLGLNCISLHLLHKCFHYARSYLTPSLAKEGEVCAVQCLMLASWSWTSSKGQISQHWTKLGTDGGQGHLWEMLKNRQDRLLAGYGLGLIQLHNEDRTFWCFHQKQHHLPEFYWVTKFSLYKSCGKFHLRQHFMLYAEPLSFTRAFAAGSDEWTLPMESIWDGGTIWRETPTKPPFSMKK